MGEICQVTRKPRKWVDSIPKECKLKEKHIRLNITMYVQVSGVDILTIAFNVGYGRARL